MSSHILIKLAIFGFVLMSVAGDVSHLGKKKKLKRTFSTESDI
jgi:hypothetical protein